MPSNRRIKVGSPRSGIMKSVKLFEEQEHKQKRIKIDFVNSKRSISIDDQASLENNGHLQNKQKFTTHKNIGQNKKGCLKNVQKSGISLKKINSGHQAQMISCKSINSSKSIKFNKKTNIFTYNKAVQAKQVPKKITMKPKYVPAQQNEGNQCCLIF